jgi:hypothetical protein
MKEMSISPTASCGKVGEPEARDSGSGFLQKTMR